jgi:hypothetical protein
MTTVLNEVRKQNTYTSKSGVPVIVHNVLTKVLVDEFGTKYESHSLAVAMRLDELTNKALQQATSGDVYEFEF